MNWKPVGEGNWNTEARWEFSVVFSKLEGLLVVEWDSVQKKYIHKKLMENLMGISTKITYPFNNCGNKLVLVPVNPK